MRQYWLVIIVALSLSACSSAQELGAGKTGKSFVTTGHSYDEVWMASITGVQTVKGDQKLEVDKSIIITAQDKAAGRIEAKSGVSLFSWGEVVGVFITPQEDAPQHTIEVESKAALKTNITANNWEDEVIASIKKELSK